jgi:hypothetical protein
MTKLDGFIPPHGGYENLLSFQKAKIVFDGTVFFCRRFLEKRDRTVDQMVQAARSGKQNIVEGSLASATSKEAEIKRLMWRERAWANSLKITTTFCVCATCGSGKRIAVRLLLRAGWARAQMCRMRPIRSISRPAHRSRGQYSRLSHSPDQLSARPATSTAREKLSARRRLARTHDPRPASRKDAEENPSFLSY